MPTACMRASRCASLLAARRGHAAPQRISHALVAAASLRVVVWHCFQPSHGVSPCAAQACALHCLPAPNCKGTRACNPHFTQTTRPTARPPPCPRHQGTYNALRKLVETKWAVAGDAKKPVVAWVTTNSSGVSFRLDPYKMTLIKVGGNRVTGRCLAARRGRALCPGAPCVLPQDCVCICHPLPRHCPTRPQHAHTFLHPPHPYQDAGGVSLPRDKLENVGVYGSNSQYGTQYVFVPRSDIGAIARLLGGAGACLGRGF